MLTLYYSPGSCSIAARIVLDDIGKPYQLERISIRDGEHESARFLQINPRGRIPVLVEDSGVLVENLAILTYLASASPEAKLFPDDLASQAQCLAMLSWLTNTVQPGFSRFFRPYRISADETSHAGIKALAKEFCWSNLAEADAILSRQQWLGGDAYSISDPCGLVYCAWAIRIGLPLQDLKFLAAFKDRMLGRPNVKRILQDESNILLDG
jgi:glutathione S-transferase